MPFLAKLIDRAAVSRWSLALSETREHVGSYSAVSGMESLPCLLIEGQGNVSQEMFGREFACDALCYFAAGVELNPNPTSGSGRSDKVVVTAKNGQVTTWIVVGYRNNANKNRGNVAALQKWSA